MMLSRGRAPGVAGNARSARARAARWGCAGATHGAARRVGRSTHDTSARAQAADAAAVEGSAEELVPRLPPAAGPVMVWFKHDLRVGDHPGLLAALRSGGEEALVVPFFCLDPDLYCSLALTPAGPATLLAALTRLRAELRALGSDLVVRLGPAPTTCAAFAGLAGVTRIVTEREAESRWLEACHGLSDRLAAAGVPARITTWTAPVWRQGAFDPNFGAWREARGEALDPLAAPCALPPLPAGIEPGALPELERLEALLGNWLAAARPPSALGSRPGSPAPPGSRPGSPVPAARRGGGGGAWTGERGAAREAVLAGMLSEPDAAAHAPDARRIAELLLLAGGDAGGGAGAGSGPDTGVAGTSGGGGVSAEDVLRAYLVADGMTPPDARLAFMRGAVAALEGPAAPGGSFPALLGPLVGLGALSPRQVRRGALAAEAARWGGRVPPFGPGTATGRAALDAVELADFHRQLAGHIPQEGDAPPAPGGGSPGATGSWADAPVASATASYEEGPDGVEQWGVADWPAGVPRRCSWRWRGALTDYCVVEPPTPRPGAPAIVLVHGFGAFGDQWRFNLGPLAAAGFRVFAPTLPGFGRSEKAALPYSQNAWRDFVRDFLVCVVGEPAVLAGNSIGGFIAASTAADYAPLVAGLVLVNAAGPIAPGATDDSVAAAAAEVKRPPPAWVVRGATWALMTYLRTSIAKQLAWLYPTNPANADAWLEGEIYRASCDARSADVFASVFYLPRPRPLNYLVSRLFKGPTGVVQGVLDPLNDAGGRAALLRETCPGLRVWQLQAGHCPHDEVPEQVNAALLEFVETMVLQGGGAGGGAALGARRAGRLRRARRRGSLLSALVAAAGPLAAELEQDMQGLEEQQLEDRSGLRILGGISKSILQLWYALGSDEGSLASAHELRASAAAAVGVLVQVCVLAPDLLELNNCLHALVAAVRTAGLETGLACLGDAQAARLVPGALLSRLQRATAEERAQGSNQRCAATLLRLLAEMFCAGPTKAVLLVKLAKQQPGSAAAGAEAALRTAANHPHAQVAPAVLSALCTKPCGLQPTAALVALLTTALKVAAAQAGGDSDARAAALAAATQCAAAVPCLLRDRQAAGPSSGSSDSSTSYDELAPWLALAARALALAGQVLAPPAGADAGPAVGSHAGSAEFVPGSLTAALSDLQAGADWLAASLPRLAEGDAAAAMTGQAGSTASSLGARLLPPPVLAPLVEQAAAASEALAAARERLQAAGPGSGNAAERLPALRTAVGPALAAQLAALGAAVCGVLPLRRACSNPACANLAGLSEAALARGSSCVCSGCCVVRVCGPACHKAQPAAQAGSGARIAMSAFTSLELGRDPKELAAGELSLKHNPLLVSIMDGCETLKALQAKTKLTPEHIAGAKGLVLLRTDKIGFGISVTQGYGLVLLRAPNAPSGWSAPLPLKVDGFSMGAVVGYSEQHTLLLLTSNEEVAGFANDKRTMRVGLDLGLAVGKKLNESKALHAGQLKKEERAAGDKAFTVSKGYIVDVSLKGTSVEPDSDDMAAAYGEGTTPADGRVKPPRQAALLYNALAAIEGRVGAAAPGI
ncbi:cry [Scenedesmus sp. PABB004]|nr:cry [Scenedesmus sp. PABB004]